MMRCTSCLAVLALLAGAGATLAFPPDEDNVTGLPEIRRDIRAGIRSGNLGSVGPWNLRYVGPHRPGTVNLWALPIDVFETRETAKDGYEVHLKHPDKLFTKFVGELKPIGVAITKTDEGPGLGRVDLTFQTIKGGDLPLEEMKKRGMILSLTWSPKEACRFLRFAGHEAAFQRTEGYDDAEVWVHLRTKEEGHVFTYREVLPRVGLAPEDEDTAGQ